MGDYTQANLDSTVKSAWEMAENACFDYLCWISGSKAGYSAMIGDSPQDSTKINLWTFMISGSDDVQRQNYQCPTPNKYFYVNGALAGLYKLRREAQFLAGSIMNGLPAYHKDDPDMEEGSTPNRGLEPNVDLFELKTFPECYSFKEEGKDRIWILTMNFRIVYTDSEN